MHGAYQGKNRIGWDNLTLGKISRKTIELQDWWTSESPVNIERKNIGSREQPKKAVAIFVLTIYETWKQRSVKLIEKEGPSRIRVLRKQAKKLQERQDKVERSDASLFHSRRIHREGDGEQRYEDWIEAVLWSIKLNERKEMKDAERLAKTIHCMQERMRPGAKMEQSCCS